MHCVRARPAQERQRRLGFFQLNLKLRKIRSDIVDVGIACAGTQEIPAVPKRGKRDTDASWAAKELDWSQRRNAAYDAWEALKMERVGGVIVEAGTFVDMGPVSINPNSGAILIAFNPRSNFS